MLLKLLKTIAVDALYLLMWPKHVLRTLGLNPYSMGLELFWLLTLPLLLIWWVFIIVSSFCGGCWTVIIFINLFNGTYS